MKVINLSTFQVFSADKMKKNNIFQTPRFFCDVYCFEPGQEQIGHVHGEQDKVYLVLEGNGTFQVGTDKQVLGPGQGTMAPAGEAFISRCGETFPPPCSWPSILLRRWAPSAAATCRTFPRRH